MATPNEAKLREMLAYEQTLRLSDAMQKRYREAEEKADTDWMEVTIGLQKQVLWDFGYDPNDPKILYQLRMAAVRHPDLALQVRYNRARKGKLRVGDAAPDVPLVQVATPQPTDIAATPATTVHAVQEESRHTSVLQVVGSHPSAACHVLMSGSYS
jgi:hypothetical protein